MTPVISPLLKAHITRFNGSMGSGTDLGRTKVSAVDGWVAPTAASGLWANSEKYNTRTTSTVLLFLRPGGIFNVLAFFAFTACFENGGAGDPPVVFGRRFAS